MAVCSRAILQRAAAPVPNECVPGCVLSPAEGSSASCAGAPCQRAGADRSRLHWRSGSLSAPARFAAPPALARPCVLTKLQPKAPSPLNTARAACCTSNSRTLGQRQRLQPACSRRACVHDCTVPFCAANASATFSLACRRGQGSHRRSAPDPFRCCTAPTCAQMLNSLCARARQAVSSHRSACLTINVHK